MKRLVRVVETTYAATLMGDVDAWVARTADALASYFCLGSEHGIVGSRYDASGSIVRQTSGATRALTDDARSLVGKMCRNEQRVVAGIGGGAVRILGLRAGEADGPGALFSVPFPRRSSLRPAERDCFERLAIHLAAAYRLVTCIGTLTRGVQPEDAPLRAVVRAMDRAALAAATAPSPLWSALAGGRHSLVDRFECDGSRFVVVHEAPPGATDPRALTKQERTIAASVALAQADKVIADELGLGEGTVRAHVHAILSKLGLSSRAQLVTLLLAPYSARTLRLGPEGPRVTVFAHDERPGALDQLTFAERAVVELARRGVRTSAIAAQQRKTAGTVTKQLASAYSKLGVGSRAELAVLLDAT